MKLIRWWFVVTTLMLMAIALAPMAMVEQGVAADVEELIIPNQRIGAIHLGMSEAEVDRVNTAQKCQLSGSAFKHGKAVMLATNFGGTCATVPGRIMVGTAGTMTMRLTFGEPDRIERDRVYDGAVAYWMDYTQLGIGFRVLFVTEGEFTGMDVIQQIRVFTHLYAPEKRQSL